MSTIALAWSFATPSLSAAIVGGSKAAYLDAAAEAVHFELSDEDRESISKLYKSKPVVRPLLTSDVFYFLFFLLSSARATLLCPCV